MKFKLEKVTEDFITVSVNNDGLIIVADFSRKKFKEQGYLDAENVKFINDEIPTNAASILPKMMQELGDWVVKNHSDKLV